MADEVKHTPDRIWAQLDRATVYMDGSSPLVASTREFRGASEYVAATSLDLLVAEMPDEDDIEEAISGSINIDWTTRDAAKAVMRLFEKGVNKQGRNGELLEKSCPNDPESDPKNENIGGDVNADLLNSIRSLLKKHEAHHNSIEHSAARAAIARATGAA